MASTAKLSPPSPLLPCTAVFEENGLRATPFSNQFGLQNVYGVAKPVYRAFELLNNAGDKRAAVTSSASVSDEWKKRGARGSGRPVSEAGSLLRYAFYLVYSNAAFFDVASLQDGIVSVLPTVYSNSTDVRLYLSNFRRLDMGSIPAANITVQLHGLSSSASTASVIRLDNDHLTAVEVWQKAGRRRDHLFDVPRLDCRLRNSHHNGASHS